MQMNLNIDSGTVTVLNGTPGEIVRYIGSKIWSVKYVKRNITRVDTFKTTEIEFNGQDMTYLERKYR